MKELKENVEKLAKEQGKTEIEIITALQAAAVVTNDEALLDMLCELKWDYIEPLQGDEAKDPATIAAINFWAGNDRSIEEMLG